METASLNEALNSLYVVLASSHDASLTGSEVAVAIAALEQVTHDLPQCRPASIKALEGHSRELHSLLDNLADLQDAAASKEEEAGVLRQVVLMLERLQRVILDKDHAVDVTAMAGAAQDYSIDEDEEEEEDDEDDDPFFMPLPSAIKMADANKFFVLAQPLTVEQPAPFVLVLEPDTPSLSENDSSSRIASDLSTLVGSALEADSNQAGMTAASVLADSEGAEATSRAITSTATAAQAAAEPSASRDEPIPASAHSYLQADDPGAGAALGATAASTADEPKPPEADDKLNQFVDFLHGKRPGSNMFHEKMELTLQGCMKLAEFVSSTGRIRALSLSRNNIGDEGLKILCEGLSVNRSVTALDLPDNQITDAGAAQLSRSLANHPSLTQLQLSNNKISDLGAICIAELISSSRSLTQIGLAFNNIGKAGCQALRDAICQNPSLKRLQLLPGNPVAEEEAKALAKALKRNNSFSFRSFLLTK